MGTREGFNALFSQLADLGFKGSRVTIDTLHTLDNSKGAHLLIIRQDDYTKTSIKSLNSPALPSGWYFYAGSANGGGGIKARLKRHLSDDKKLHWHIDHVTTRANAIEALAIAGGDECEITDRLYKVEDFAFPIPDFGSSDCKRCKSHLLTIKKD